jgi:hypothetical protein
MGAKGLWDGTNYIDDYTRCGEGMIDLEQEVRKVQLFRNPFKRAYDNDPIGALLRAPWLD